MSNHEEEMKRYSIWDNTKQVLSDLQYMGYRHYGYLLFDCILSMLVPFMLILIPSKIVYMLENNRDFYHIMTNIILWVSMIIFMNIIQGFSHDRMERAIHCLVDTIYGRNLHLKMLSCDITSLEKPKEKERLQQAMQVCQGMDGNEHYAGFQGFCFYGTMLVINVGGFVLYALIAADLHIVLLVLLVVLSIINSRIHRKGFTYEINHIDAFWENSFRFWYLKNQSTNLKSAKDIRMYHLHDWFHDALHKNTQEAIDYYGDIQNHYFYSNIALRLTTFLRDILSYGYLMWQMVQGNLSLSSFLLYVGIVAGFGTWMDQIVESFSFFKRCSAQISMYRCYMEEGKAQQETKMKQTVPLEIQSIVFDDVSFAYPDGEMLFQHFHLTLHAKEKVAIVGMNGAGKTTLMKLLCGLYPLQEGRILVNGVDIKEIDKDTYADYISILFQNVNVLPFSIAKNVSCSSSEKEQQEMANDQSMVAKLFQKMDRKPMQQNQYDENKIENCLKKANLWDKISSLPKGIHTVMTQKLDEEGVSLSGGENQRLMLARALYKDAPILILDEPTSALDPIAEGKLYEDYAKLCENKISVFISHRLSSTRFCDRILFMEHGEIREEGSHDELMKQHGKYAKMFEIQSYYYQKEVKRHEAGI